MNICFVCSEYPPSSNGGIGTFIKELSETLVRLGHKVRVIGLYDEPERTETINGVEIYRLKKSQKPFMWIFDLRRVFRIIKQWDVKGELDLVEDNDWDSYSSFFGRLSVPIILRIHNRYLSVIGDLSEFELSRRLKLKRAVNRATSIVGVSKDILESLIRLTSVKSHTEVIYNGVLVSERRYPTENRIPNKVMFAGTLVEEKGIVNLIKSWVSVIKLIPEAQLFVFGKDKTFKNGGSMIDHLNEILGDYRSSVEFVGHVSKSELNKHFKDSMLFISPSFFEAFSLAPLEAMAYGCPTIFTKLSSGPEAIESGEDGLLIDPNDINEISTAIVSLLKDSSVCEKFSHLGYERVRRDFNVENTAQKNIEFYKTIIQS